MKTFAPDLEVGQLVKIIYKKPKGSTIKAYEIRGFNASRTKVLLDGLWGEFEPDDLEILRGELKEFKDVK